MHWFELRGPKRAICHQSWYYSQFSKIISQKIGAQIPRASLPTRMRTHRHEIVVRASCLTMFLFLALVHAIIYFTQVDGLSGSFRFARNSFNLDWQSANYHMIHIKQRTYIPRYNHSKTMHKRGREVSNSVIPFWSAGAFSHTLFYKAFVHKKIQQCTQGLKGYEILVSQSTFQDTVFISIHWIHWP